MKLVIAAFPAPSGGRQEYRFRIDTLASQPLGVSKRYKACDSAVKALRAVVTHVTRVEFYNEPEGSSFAIRSPNGSVVFKSNLMDTETRDTLYHVLKAFCTNGEPKTYTYNRAELTL